MHRCIAAAISGLLNDILIINYFLRLYGCIFLGGGVYNCNEHMRVYDDLLKEAFLKKNKK